MENLADKRIMLAVILIERPFPNQELEKKEQYAFYILLAISMVAGLLYSFHLGLPNPTTILTSIYTLMGHEILSFFK
ncbi:hypothetical protein [Paenibacillus xylanivorans]|uniref:Uncharacterized protein n=1 Tax=Paenibacillus xylanivorans TaxID=1705561 RepID=A0A0M9BS41_9BACL|nr:hypothetical protein [Paenibacillus xylanivorans]KOY17948.1 hypothetical protein AMS66_03135 [Paenibacillus xylanivorans]